MAPPYIIHLISWLLLLHSYSPAHCKYGLGSEPEITCFYQIQPCMATQPLSPQLSLFLVQCMFTPITPFVHTTESHSLSLTPTTLFLCCLTMPQWANDSLAFAITINASNYIFTAVNTNNPCYLLISLASHLPCFAHSQLLSISFPSSRYTQQDLSLLWAHKDDLCTVLTSLNTPCMDILEVTGRLHASCSPHVFICELPLFLGLSSPLSPSYCLPCTNLDYFGLLNLRCRQLV